MAYTLPLLLPEAGLELLFEAGHLVSDHDTKSHKQPKELSARQKVGRVLVEHEGLGMGKRRVVNIVWSPHPQKPSCVAACSDITYSWSLWR